ncbi:SIS domain-containing protein [Erysipelothrix sp. D19-032]
MRKDLNHLLLTIGLKCIILDDYNLLSIITPTIDPREVIILISLSGETRKIVEATKIVKSRNVSIISITSFTHNVLARMSDINLYTASDSVATKNE